MRRGRPRRRPRPRLWIRRTGVRDDADASLAGSRQHRGHPVAEQRIEARGRIAPPLELAQRDRPLGEALEHQEVEVTPFDEVDRRVDPVVGEAGAGADSDTLRASVDDPPEVPRRPRSIAA